MRKLFAYFKLFLFTLINKKQYSIVFTEKYKTMSITHRYIKGDNIYRL